MPVTIEPTPENVTELKLGVVNVRRARGDEPAQRGGVVPQGQLSVSVTLRRYNPDARVDGQDLATITVQDVEAWIGQLVADADPLAMTAAGWFAQVDEALKKLAALRGSQFGLCARPTA